MEDEDFNWTTSTDLNGYYNENDEFDLLNYPINENGELLDIFGLDKPPPEASTSHSTLLEQSMISTTLNEASFYDPNQLHLNGEYFVEVEPEEEEEHEQPVAAPVTSPVELPVTVANFSADNSQADNNTFYSNAIVLEPPAPVKVNARPPGRERGRKRATSSCVDAFDDQTLAAMSVSDLRLQMSNATREDLDSLTKRRRTVLNRLYARTSRQKRTRERSESEKSKKTTEEELQSTRNELHYTQERLAAMTVDCNMWRSKYEALLNDYVGNKTV